MEIKNQKKRKSTEGGVPSISNDVESKAKQPPNQEAMGAPHVNLDIGKVDASAKSSDPPSSAQAQAQDLAPVLYFRI